MDQDKYNLIISNGALQKLKELAAYLGIPESELHQVVANGMKLVDVARTSKLYKEDPDGKRYLINVKEI